VTAHTAKLVSRAIVVAVVAMLALSIALMFLAGDQAASDHVVVVGDPNAPGMAEVQAQLLRDAQPGDRFGEIATGDLIFALIGATIAVAWAITGALIVSRQPKNSAGWIFCAGAVSITLNVSALVYVVYSVRIASNPLPGQDFVALIGEYSFALVALIPLALRGVTYRPAPASVILRRNLTVYGLGGLIVPFVGIKLIDLLLTALGLV